MKKSIKHFSLLAVLVAMFTLVAVAVYAAGSDGSAQNSNLDMSLVFSPETELTVYVDGAWDSTRSDTYGFGDNVSLTAPEVSGKTFSHWEADGSVISYANPLKLTMNAHTTLYAVYTGTAPEKKAACGFTSISRTNDGGSILFQGLAYPNGGTIATAGIVYSTTADTADKLMINGEGVTDVAAVKNSDLQASSSENIPTSVLDKNNCWMLQIAPEGADTVYHARAYVTIGSETIYGDVKDVKLSDLENGVSMVANPEGFEPGINDELAKLASNVYTISFDANGGTGKMAQQAAVGDMAVLLNTNIFTREGYTFSGWSTTPTGSVEYTDGASVTFNADITLYAQWKTPGSSGSGNGGGGYVPYTPSKTTPEKPAAPTLESKTDTTITVKTVEGQEYSIDGGKIWQTSGTFTGLTPETEYSIVTKIMETSTADESPVSDVLKVTTDRKADSSTPAPATPESSTTPTATPAAPGSTTKPTATPAAPTKQPDATSTPVSAVSAKEKATAALSLNAGLKVIHKGKTATVQWGKVSGADFYRVYAGYCGGKAFLVKTVKSGAKCKITIKKLNGKSLSTTKNIKVYVAAYRKAKVKSGTESVVKNVRIAKTITGHVVGKNNKKYSNAKKIKLSQTSYTLKKGKKAQVGAKTVLEYPKRKQLSDAHAKEFRYATSNKSIATVSKTGKITAKKKGSCIIYVYARNGLAKKVKIKVK